MNIAPLTNSFEKYKIIKPGVIEGYWNEDQQPFQITCPVQLQNMLLYILNNLEVNDVTISSSKNADTRSAKVKVTKEELLKNSIQHIGDVNQAINWMISELRKTATKHDYTKLENIDEFYNNFKFIQDGNDGDFKQMNWFKEFHLKERHHLTDRCPDDVNLFDVLERISDIVMAGMARTGTLYEDRLPVEILNKAYHNTIKLLASKTKVRSDNVI